MDITTFMNSQKIDLGKEDMKQKCLLSYNTLNFEN